MGNLRSSSARQAQLLLQQDKHEVGSECGPGGGGAPLKDPHSCQPHPHTHCHTWLSPQDRSPLSAHGEGDKSPTPGQHKRTPSSVPRAGGPMARPRRDGMRAVQWEQHGPRMVASPCPHLVPPTPGVGSSQQPLCYLFSQPLGIFLVRAVCSQVVPQAKGQLGTGTQASAILLVCWAPSGSSTALVPTCVPPVTPHSVTDSSSTL